MLIKIPAWPGQPRLPGLLECHKKPLLLLSLKDLLKRSYRRVDSICDAKFTATTSLNNLMQNLLVHKQKRIESSIEYFKSVWKKWCGWCSEREISPTRPDMNDMVDFMAELLENGLQYRTIVTQRSEISEMFHEPIGNIPVGNHPRVFPSCQEYSIRDLPNQIIILLRV